MTERAMRQNYAATVRLLLTDDVATDGEAADAISGLLTECGIYQDAIKDWSYMHEDGRWKHAELVTVPVDYDRDEDTIPGSGWSEDAALAAIVGTAPATPPDHANDTVDALVLAQAQLETLAEFDKGNGGEDSDLHTALKAVKAAIVREQARPDALRDCIGALDSCLHQIEQMRGMFGDEDGTIQAAVDDAEEAQENARKVLG